MEPRGAVTNGIEWDLLRRHYRYVAVFQEAYGRDIENTLCVATVQRPE
jgi:hypothetical protein